MRPATLRSTYSTDQWTTLRMPMAAVVANRRLGRILTITASTISTGNSTILITTMLVAVSIRSLGTMTISNSTIVHNSANVPAAASLPVAR